MNGNHWLFMVLKKQVAPRNAADTITCFDVYVTLYGSVFVEVRVMLSSFILIFFCSQFGAFLNHHGQQ